ncbi:ATP-binding protein [bacterium]|nr:ATP-binding protein [bacterium]MBP5436174.1 ATP-binding protein [bacterium]
MAEIVLKRKTYEELLKWKKEYAPEYALFLKGARRVGKTTIAEELGKNEYKSFITINFQATNDTVRDLFVNSLLDLDYFFNVIQLQYGKKLYKRESLIILDEIQLYPLARQALKTLLADGRYDYIETGSLAGIKKKTEASEILIPSEEYAVEMFPLDFEEFLWATGDEFTFPIIKSSYEKVKPLGNLHKDIFRKFREYMCVGGMPQAVVKYIQTKDFEKVDFAKKEILALYRNDIKNQKEENGTYLGNILDNIPSELSKHEKSSSFQLSHVDKNARYREYRSPLTWLSEAMIVNVARNVTDPSPALTLSMDDERFKCYLLDTGLLINLSFGDGTFMDNEFYKAILTDRLHINEGMFVENAVAQSLRSNGHKILFYVEYNEKGKPVMEIDFLIRKSKKVVPVEVKSGREFAAKSLRNFKTKFSNRVSLQYVLYDGDVKRDNEVIFLPYYMAAVL